MKAVYIAPPSVPRGARLTTRTAADIMSTPVASICEDAPLGEALRTMVRLRRRHLAVVGADGRCTGVLADRTVAAEWARNPASLSVRRVGTALARPPAVVGPQAKVADIARLMTATGIEAVAVADVRGYPLGIVTGMDLVALLAA